MERYTASDDFGVLEEGKSDIDLSWMNELAQHENGAFVKSINNMLIVLENDVNLKGKFAIDEFTNRGMVTGAVHGTEKMKCVSTKTLTIAGSETTLRKDSGLQERIKYMMHCYWHRLRTGSTAWPNTLGTLKGWERKN